MRKITVVLGLFILAGSAASSARDIGNLPIVTQSFEYEDLDLTTDRGIALLRARSSDAIGRLCAEALGHDDGGSDYKMAAMRCKKHAQNQTQPRLDLLIAQAPERRRQILGGARATNVVVARR